MVEIADIKDRASFREWLEQEDLPREAMVALANRAAMRVLPVFWADVGLNPQVASHDLHTVVVLRALLISASYATAEDADVEVKLAASASATHADAAANNANNAAFTYATDAATHAAAFAATYAADATADATAVTAAAMTDAAAYAAQAATSAVTYAADAAAAATARAAHAAAWAALRADCQAAGNLVNLLSQPLWPDRDNPLSGQWAEVTAAVPPDRDHPFAFWRDWYQRALDGTETRWDLLQDIALLDKDETGEDLWGNPEKLTQAISDLQARNSLGDVARAHPYAWDMQVGRGAALIRVPKEVVDVTDIVAATRRALNEHRARCKVRSGQSDIGPYIEAAFAEATKELRKKLSKYKNNPAELHRVLEETRLELIGISQQEGFENDPIANRLIGNLTVRAQDVCVAAPSVLEMVEARQKVQLRLMSSDFVQTSRHLCAGLGNDATGELRVAAALALSILSDPDSSDEAKLGAFQFVQAAVPRAALAALEFEESQDQDAPGKTVAERAETWAKRIKTVDQTIDIAQEAANEHTPWVLEALQSLGRLGGGG